jgi:hypothetical protein
MSVTGGLRKEVRDGLRSGVSFWIATDSGFEFRGRRMKGTEVSLMWCGGGLSIQNATLCS